MISLGVCLSFVSTFSHLESHDLLICILMNGFKIYGSVLTIQTFDTVFRSVSMHFLVMVKQFVKIEGGKDRFEFLTCLKEQFELIQKGFGSYLLFQFSFLTLSFILLSYDFMIRLLLYSSGMVQWSTTNYYLDQAGIMIVMLTNLFKMVMMAYSADWMKTSVEDVRFKLMEEREACRDENEIKVNSSFDKDNKNEQVFKINAIFFYKFDKTVFRHTTSTSLHYPIYLSLLVDSSQLINLLLHPW